MSEDQHSVSITVSVQAGTLGRDVIVTLSTISGTAMCKFPSKTQQQLVCYFSTFSSLQLEKCVISPMFSYCIAGEEYTPISTNVTFNASTSTQTVDIPILDNKIVAGSTMFSVSLTSADPAAILNPASADITIEDDDSEKPPVL